MSSELSREEISQIVACLDDGTYTKQERKDFNASATWPSRTSTAKRPGG